MSWKIVLIVSSGSGYVAIHEINLCGTEDDVTAVARNITECNSYVKVGVTIIRNLDEK